MSGTVRIFEEGKLKHVRAFFVIAALLIIGFEAVHIKAQPKTVVRMVAVPGGNYDQVVLPSGNIVGFSCASGIADVRPNCYLLVK